MSEQSCNSETKCCVCAAIPHKERRRVSQAYTLTALGLQVRIAQCLRFKIAGSVDCNKD